MRPHLTSVRAIGNCVPVLGMVIGLLVLYCPPGILDGHATLLGFDYNDVHARRIEYAQEAFSRGSWAPAWYTRELLGTPFRSNLQSFPLLPTRLGLLWLDPSALYPVAVNLAAILAALFTYLFCRALDLGRLAAAAAGWTFSASGFFAVRILGGQLPSLEAFAALPLLLWILEHLVRGGTDRRIVWWKHVSLALAVGCIALAGHPQIPSYAIAAAIVYAAVRLSGARRVRALLSIVLGLGLSAFAWCPMLHLITRSTRVADLAPADNDIPLPFWRLKAFLFPWSDGWPGLVERLPARAFVEPNQAYFWDTVGYVGWIPLLAILLLLTRALRRRRLPSRPWLCIAGLAISALLLALPILPTASDATGFTLLRSPARLLYLTTFGLAVGLGVAVDLVIRARSKARALAWTCVAVLLGLHAIDLGTHDKPFLRTIDVFPSSPAAVDRARGEVADRRVAIDYNVYLPENRRVDDIGFFDSLMLTRPYRALLAMARAPERLNIQVFDGSALPELALAGLCVQRVVTDSTRKDLRIEASGSSPGGRWTAYRVRDPARRATFLPDRSVRFVEEPDVLERFRGGRFDLRAEAMLPPSVRPADFGSGSTGSAQEPVVRLVRPDPDHIEIQIDVQEPGYVRIMESWDDGWSATLDGRPAEIVLSDACAMAVRVRPGDRSIRMCYRTPGATIGWVLTVLSALGLIGLRGLIRSDAPPSL